MSKARRQVWMHYGLMGGWVLLLVPSFLWWKESLLWIILMSQYANIVGHWSAAQAARAELSGEE